jgi:pyrroline-5-carboxylate reductase
MLSDGEGQAERAPSRLAWVLKGRRDSYGGTRTDVLRVFRWRVAPAMRCPIDSSAALSTRACGPRVVSRTPRQPAREHGPPVDTRHGRPPRPVRDLARTAETGRRSRMCAGPTGHHARVRYGFLGAGAITRAIVEGLSGGAPGPPAVLLSPRNAEVAADLAARFANVTVCSSNASLVEQAGTVVVAVRPQDAGAALHGLPFTPAHTVISVIAGLSVDTVAHLAAPATPIVRAIPLPSAARRAGIIPIYPFNQAAKVLFERVGRVVTAPTETAFDAYSAATALIAGHLDYLDAVSRWLSGQGVPLADARRYIASMFADLSAGFDTCADFAEMASHHATPGGINEQVRDTLTAAGAHQIVRQALSGVLARISSSGPQPPVT